MSAAECGNGLQEEGESCEDGGTVGFNPAINSQAPHGFQFPSQLCCSTRVRSMSSYSVPEQVDGDGCDAACQCEQDPCAFSVAEDVNLTSVVSALRPGASLALAAGRWTNCGWSVWSANGGDERPITIRGQGPSQTVVDCAHATSVVDSVINGTALRLVGIHFVNAHRNNGKGSVLRADGGSDVKIENCRVSNCSTTDSDGGAIFVSDSGLTVRTSHFEGNSAADKGGALAIDGGTCTLIDSTFMHCFADQGVCVCVCVCVCVLLS